MINIFEKVQITIPTCEKCKMPVHPGNHGEGYIYHKKNCEEFKNINEKKEAEK